MEALTDDMCRKVMEIIDEVLVISPRLLRRDCHGFSVS